MAETAAIREGGMQPDSRWRFFTDGVMGGVSTGQVTRMEEDGQTHLRMTGRVSTANRGGFIQMRRDLDGPPPEGTTGVRLVARGNGQRYFVHLRTRGTLMPWQYYQAGFDVTETWSELRLPFAAFTPSGALLRGRPAPGAITSVAVVAYGRDHDARIDLREIGFF
ncbi:MAG: CIA30 family protein [Gemmobacter sp.]